MVPEIAAQQYEHVRCRDGCPQRREGRVRAARRVVGRPIEGEHGGDAVGEGISSVAEPKKATGFASSAFSSAARLYLLHQRLKVRLGVGCAVDMMPEVHQQPVGLWRRGQVEGQQRSAVGFGRAHRWR